MQREQKQQTHLQYEQNEDDHPQKDTADGKSGSAEVVEGNVGDGDDAEKSHDHSHGGLGQFEEVTLVQTLQLLILELLGFECIQNLYSKSHPSFLNNNNKVHLSCAHQCPEHSHDA